MSNVKYMIPMLDGGLVNYSDDEHSYSGCPTCDYGSEYISECDLDLTTIKIKVRASQMYEYAISVGDMMKTLLYNYDAISKMTEAEFAMWFEKELTGFDPTDIHQVFSRALRNKNIDVTVIKKYNED